MWTIIGMTQTENYSPNDKMNKMGGVVDPASHLIFIGH